MLINYAMKGEKPITYKEWVKMTDEEAIKIGREWHKAGRADLAVTTMDNVIAGLPTKKKNPSKQDIEVVERLIKFLKVVSEDIIASKITDLLKSPTFLAVVQNPKSVDIKEIWKGIFDNIVNAG